MKDSKRSSNERLAIGEKEQTFEEASLTTSPSVIANISRFNTIDESDDKPYEAGRSQKVGSNIDRDKIDLNLRDNDQSQNLKDLDVFKQLPQALELLKTIPLEHRKKVRHIVKIYEDERKDYETEIRRLTKLIPESLKQRKLSQPTIRIDITSQKEDYSPTLTPTSLCFSDSLFDQVYMSMNYQQIIKINQYVQFVSEGFDHTKIKHAEQIDNYREIIVEKDAQIKKAELKLDQLNSLMEVLQMKIKGYEDNLKSVYEENQGLIKKIQDVQKSIKQRRDDVRPNITVTITQPDQIPQSQSRLGVHKDLTIQNRMSTSPPDRSPTYTNKHPKISLRDQLNRTSHPFLQKKQQQQNHHSECDSSEFGKEKVIQKRKLRKLFANLLSASNTSQKKDILQKLSIEIGLKTKDINSLFKNI